MQGQETPGPGPPETHSRHEEVRALVLDAAAMLFADKGIRRTTVRDIAAAAGVEDSLAVVDCALTAHIPA